MNQIVKLFEESNSRLAKIMTGKYNREQLLDAQREADHQVKLLNIVNQAFAISSKNKRTLAALGKMNIMDENTAIDVGLPLEDGKVNCPVQETLITKGQCLDRSGDKQHREECEGCDVGRAVKHLLLAPPE